MIKSPPKRESLPSDVFTYIGKNCPEKIKDYLNFYQPVDSKGRYLHFDDFRHRVPQGLDVNLAWAITKIARITQQSPLFHIGESPSVCHFMLTPTIQKAISETDRSTTTAALELMSSKIGEEQHFNYLLNDLIEDEAISSSQLEGAATTTLVAKEMIKRKRQPRTPDEKMILGNYRMMKFAWDHRNEDLTTDLIEEMHRVGVEGIDDEKYTPGHFRNSDDVVVTDGDGNVVHQPPPAKGIKERLSILCDWTNTLHDEIETINYIHPLIKAISLHFAIGYEHPFRDGNGRVARALFYWFMFKNDYAAFRYIAISVLLKEAAIKYGKSYLYTETDDMDMTYFIDYQCSIILRAISSFKEAYYKTLKEIEDFNKWLWKSGLYNKLSDKQKTVFQVAKSGIAKYFTANTVKDNLGCSYNTASSVLNGLVSLGVFEKEKNGREWIYFMLEKNDIKKRWKH